MNKTVLVGLLSCYFSGLESSVRCKDKIYNEMEAVRVKRYGYIYEKIYDMSNLRRAYHEAKRDKGHYGEVIAISGNVDYHLRQIQDMLRNETYVISPDDYEVFTKDDKGKLRVIHKLDFFPHRIIQWAVMLQIQDILLANLTTDTYASLPRRGIHLASNNLKYALENDVKETQYCLKMDIKKFYPSINHEINKRLLERKFKDPKLLRLLFMLVESMGGERGIAIGSLFSQWDSNFFLSGFDHWLKENKKVKHYFRYMDDLVILHADKKYLHQMRKDIEEYLSVELDLELKENYQVFPVDKLGIDFVGYRHFRDYTLLRKTTAANLKVKMSSLKKKLGSGGGLTYGEWCSINSYKGWLKECDGHALYNKYIRPLEKYNREYKQRIKSGRIKAPEKIVYCHSVFC